MGKRERAAPLRLPLRLSHDVALEEGLARRRHLEPREVKAVVEPDLEDLVCTDDDVARGRDDDPRLLAVAMHRVGPARQVRDRDHPAIRIGRDPPPHRPAQ